MFLLYILNQIIDHNCTELKLENMKLINVVIIQQKDKTDSKNKLHTIM